MFGTIFTIALLALFGVMLVALFTRKSKPVAAVTTREIETPKPVVNPRLTEEQVKDAVLFLLKTQRSAPNGLSQRVIRRRLNERGIGVTRNDVFEAVHRLFAKGMIMANLSRRGKWLFQAC